MAAIRRLLLKSRGGAAVTAKQARVMLQPDTGRLGYGWRVLALAALYCVAGWAGLQLAQPPGYATPIWPPSGIMLALLLLWGRGVWPGVWLGSFAVNLWVGLAQAAPISADLFVIAGAIASGSTAEGLVGAALVQRYVPAPKRLESGRDVWRFFLLGGSLASTIAASVGSATLYLRAGLPLQEVPYNWLTWWVGDSMGVFLVAPLLLVWGGDPRPAWRLRLRTVAVTVLVSVAVGAAVVQQTNRSERDRVRTEFDERASTIDSHLRQTLTEASDALATLGDHFAASRFVAPAEFERLANGLLRRAPALAAVAWAPRVSAAQRALDPEAESLSGETRIVEIDASGALRVAQGRDAYFPLRYIHPLAGREDWLGFDLGSKADRAQTMRRAAAHDAPQLTPLIARVDGRGGGVLLVLAVSGPQGPGYLSGAIELDALMAHVLAVRPLQHLAVSVRDLSAPATGRTLYRSSPAIDADGGLHWSAVHEIGGRRWQFDIDAGRAYLLSKRSLQAWLTQVGVLMFSALLGAFLLVLTGRSARVEEAVRERTAELRNRNAVLREEVLQRQRSEASFRGIFESAMTGIAFADRRARIVRCNDAYCALLGRSEAELKNLAEGVYLTHPDDVARETEYYRSLCDGTRTRYRIEKRLLRPDGSTVWVDTMVSALHGDGEQTGHFVIIAVDITERREAERHQRLAAEVFEHIGEAVLITDHDNRIVHVNRTFTTITGYASDEVMGCNPRLLASGLHDESFYRELWTGLNENGIWRGEVWDRRKNGECFPESLNLSLVRDAQGKVTNHVAVFADISERKAAEERMLFLAQMDALTHLPNRYLLGERLRQAMEISRRSRKPFAVMFIDIDRFKNINDSLGHGIGDTLLKEVARRLSASVRASDTVARQGGDEFVIVLPDVDDVEQVAHLASKLLETVALPYRIEQLLLNATASIGIAMYPADASDPEGLMKHADAAMYVAKSAGRNAFRFFTPDMNQRVQAFLRIENELRAALKGGELRLHYQPQYDVSSGEIVGAEALVRWQHPQRGLILPGEFIHVAEESGLIEALGDWVLDEACRQNRAWQDAGLKPIPVAVNLSAAELHRGNTVARVERALRNSGLAAHLLELEVTESMLMQDPERIGTVLERLRSMGVMISLDDFGTGYSSLAHLRRFPLSALKVDRSFVRDLQTDSNDAAICRAVIALGRSLGLRVVAEGVENAAQLAFLRANQCDVVQGALFSWAVPAEAFARKLITAVRAEEFML